jgi:hypothetical protein
MEEQNHGGEKAWSSINQSKGGEGLSGGNKMQGGERIENRSWSFQ